METVRRTQQTQAERHTIVRAFLIADIRGYTTFTRLRGDAAAGRLAGTFADLARDAVCARNGSVIELRGDEALAVFEDPAQAVRAGIELQQLCAEQTARDPDYPFPVGVGLDCGDVVPVEDGFRGAAINLAARLCSKAQAGEVLATKRLIDRVGEIERAGSEQREAVAVKGYADPVEFVALTAPPALHVIAPEQQPVPPELETDVPLVGREEELHWLRGTWRQAARGHGRVVFVSGPEGIGKTRLAAELAENCEGSIVHAGIGGAGGAECLAAVEQARGAQSPTFVILEDLNLYGEAIDALAGAIDEIESRPVLVLGLFRDAADRPSLSTLVDRVDVRRDGHRRLRPLTTDAILQIAGSYVDDAGEVPADAIAKASGGVPRRIHELVREWARDEANRRARAAASWLQQERGKLHAAELEFANNAIGVRLGRLYTIPEPEAPTDECPYKGLASFQAVDARYFFGRERLVGALAARMVGIGLLGVVGPSGNGKSSLVLAGLLPSLAAGLLPGSDRWPAVVLRPGEHPLQDLEATLAGLPGRERAILVIDQFEELFTSTEEAERGPFVERLVDMAAHPDRTIVILTIRGDYYGHCAAYPALADALGTNHVLVGAMTDEELRRAIELPARRVGLRIESGLTDALVAEVAEEPGGLPLLSTALVELWQERSDGWMLLDAYERTGGVRGAVARLAETAFSQLDGPEREAARSILLRLVGAGEGEAVVRRRAPIAEFDGERDPTIERALRVFTQDRLLTASDGMIEIAHEALIREWPRLADWLQEDAQGRELRRQLTEASKAWDEAGRRDAELYRGPRLSGTIDWAASHGRELNELERTFLNESRAATEREAAKQRRTNRRLRALLVGTSIFLAVALVAGVLALIQRGHARQSARLALQQRSRATQAALISDAGRVGNAALAPGTVLDASLLDGVAGFQLHDSFATSGDLLAALQRSPAALRVTHGSGHQLIGVAVSPDGNTLALADGIGAVDFIDAHTLKQAGSAITLGRVPTQRQIAFTPDGKSLAVLTQREFMVIDVATRSVRLRQSIAKVDGVEGEAMAISPDGKHLAVVAAYFPNWYSAATSKLVQIFDLGTGREIERIALPKADIPSQTNVLFFPDGKQILTSTGTLTSTVSVYKSTVWSLASKRPLETFRLGGVVAISPDGKTLAEGGWEGRIGLIDVKTGHVRTMNANHSAPMQVMAFTPDGKELVSGASDRNLIVWDVANAHIKETLSGHAGPVFGLAISPDGRTAYSTSEDGTLIAWDLSGDRRLGRSFGGTSNCFPCILMDRQRDEVVLGSGNGAVQFFDVRTLRLTRTIQAGAGGGIALSPDGTKLLTVAYSGGIAVWDIASGKKVSTRQLNVQGFSFLAAWAPDGGSFAFMSSALDNLSSTVTVLNASTGALIRRFELSGGTEYLAYGPDSRSIAAVTCCEPVSQVRVWNVQSGATLMRPDPGGAWTVAFSPDGRSLAVGGTDGNVTFWSVPSGERIGQPMRVGGTSIDFTTYSGDGKLLVVGVTDGTLSVWDPRTRQRLGIPFAGNSQFAPAQGVLSPDGQDLIVSYLGGGSYRWPMSPESWVRYACGVAGRGMTNSEWHDLLPTRSYEHVCPQ